MKKVNLDHIKRSKLPSETSKLLSCYNLLSPVIIRSVAPSRVKIMSASERTHFSPGMKQPSCKIAIELKTIWLKYAEDKNFLGM